MGALKSTIKQICKETSEWLLPGERSDFARKYKVSRTQITFILNGDRVGEKGLKILMAMHKKAMENKKHLIKVTS